MDINISNLAWIKLSDLPGRVEELKEELTKVITTYNGDQKVVTFYVLTKDYIGVPRMFALKRFNNLYVNFIDRTTKPYLPWPKIQFPPGWAYRPGQLEAITKVENSS